MTERNIKSAFRGAGFIPFDSESVVSKLDVQLRTPPPIEEIVTSTPWGSKTPNTVLEAEFQSEHLERQIRRHQCSSPEPNLKALKSFSKRTVAIIHELALVKAEVQDLPRANEILSRRRRVKRTRLKRRGVMAVEEGRQAIAQLEVVAQVAVESFRSGGQGRSAQPRERRCGICGKLGHNARTCQVVINTSEEEYSN